MELERTSIGVTDQNTQSDVWKGWDSILDPDAYARHGHSQDPGRGLGFNLQKGSIGRIGWFFFSGNGKLQHMKVGGQG